MFITKVWNTEEDRPATRRELDELVRDRYLFLNYYNRPSDIVEQGRVMVDLRDDVNGFSLRHFRISDVGGAVGLYEEVA